MKNKFVLSICVFFLAVSLGPFALVTAANANSAKVDVCHIPPGNPENAHFITVGESAAAAHVANHGDEVVPGDGSCTVGVGECAVDSSYACASGGLFCDAEPTDPPEAFEATCDDGKDNDCDGLTDLDDDDCSVAEFSATFPPADQSLAWDDFESQLSASTTYNNVVFFSDTDPGYSCTGPEANTICQAIRTQTNESCSVVTPVSVACEGNTWQVGGCGGTEVSVNGPFCSCTALTAIRAEFDAACGGGNNSTDVWGAVNGNTCPSAATTITVKCQ